MNSHNNLDLKSGFADKTRDEKTDDDSKKNRNEEEEEEQREEGTCRNDTRCLYKSSHG